MTSRRGRRAAWLFGLLGVCLLGVLVYLKQDLLREAWTLWRLDRLDPPERRAALRSLAEVGGDRSVGPVTELLHGELREEAAEALAWIVPRASPEVGTVAVRTLLEVAQPGPLARSLLEIGTRDRRYLPVFLEVLDPTKAWNQSDVTSPDAAGSLPPGFDPSRRIGRYVVQHVVVARWRVEPERTHRALQRLSYRQVYELFDPALSAPRISGLELTGSVPVVFPEAVQAFLAELGQRHEKPEVRALVLSLLVAWASPVVRGSGGGSPPSGRLEPQTDGAAEAVLRAFLDDPDRRVRLTAIRLAGYALRSEAVDRGFSRLLAESRDPRLLCEVVEARTLWMLPLDSRHSLMLPGGRFGTSLEPAAETTALRESQAARLEEILEEATDPRLRDAASVALARRHLAAQSRPAPLEPRSDLEVHEWGVWRTRDSGLRPAEERLSDLPPFVLRAQATVEEIERSRLQRDATGDVRFTVSEDSPGPDTFTFKPVLFFHTERPVSLLVEVSFRGGRPWTFFPDATDYVVKPARAGRTRMRAIEGRGDNEPPLASSRFEVHRERALPPLGDRAEPEPPWQAATGSSNSDEERETELDRWKGPAPWVRTLELPGSLAGPTGRLRLGEAGLRWCGLRVGYPPDLEGELHEAGGWWAACRQVDASTVGFAGLQDRFLFYDGTLLLDPPVRLAWADENRKRFVVEVCDDSSSGDSSGAGDTVGLFVVEKSEGAEPAGWLLRHLSPGSTRDLVLEKPPLRGERLIPKFLEVLEARGLTEAEALALLETWEAELFREPGVRVITLLPRDVYDRSLPLRIRPVPHRVVRVGLLVTEGEEIAVGPEALRRQSVCDWGKVPWRRREWCVRQEGPTSMPGEALVVTPIPLSRLEDGTLLVQGSVCRPCLSANGDVLAFGLLVDYKFMVLLLDLERWEGYGLRSRGSTGITSPFSISLAADGRRVAFTAPEGNSVDAYFGDLDGRRLWNLGQAFHVAISDDGRFVAAQRQRSIEVLEPGTGRVETVFELDLESPIVSLVSPTISADGRRVAFLAGLEVERNVYVVDRTDSWILDVSRSRGRSWMPEISSGGEHVGFVRRLDDGSSEVCVVDLETGSERRWSATPPPSSPPDITADGKTALFIGAEGLCVADVRSGDVRSLPDTESCVRACISSDGTRAVAVLAGGGRYHRIRVVDLEENAPR